GGPVQLQRVEQQRDELPIAADGRKGGVDFVLESAEGWCVHAALFGSFRSIVEQGVDREIFFLRRAVALQQCRNRFLDGEQPQCEREERGRLLDLRFTARQPAASIAR